jgi:RNA polymerase sigma-70 factor (ECF subfamily)
MRIPDLSFRRRRDLVTDAKPLDGEDRDGVNRLYRLYAGWLTRRLCAEVGADAADDVVQETYLRAAPHSAEIRHPKAFLLRIARNLLKDEARRDARRRDAPATRDPADSQAASQFDEVLLGQVVRGMPPLYRDVFVLNRFRGMTYAEIARTLGVSPKTVEWRMARALEYCASRLDL